MLRITPQTRIIALDLETTGLSAARHRIVEIAAVCWQNGEEIGRFESLVNPGCVIPNGVIRIHGITNDMVRNQPFIQDVLPAFFDFCKADYFVAHNSPFDVGFLNAECERTQHPPFTIPVLDTCALARQRMAGCPNFRLETLKAALGLGQGQEHRALSDARDCLGLFLHCAQQEHVAMRLPIDPPPHLPAKFNPLRDALRAGKTVTIEYQDTRGKVTCRQIQPLHIDQSTMEAFCLLRRDKRHFALDRIQRIWREET